MNGKKSYISAAILAAMGFVVSMGWLSPEQAMGIGMTIAGLLGASLRHAITKKDPN